MLELDSLFGQGQLHAGLFLLNSLQRRTQLPNELLHLGQSTGKLLVPLALLIQPRLMFSQVPPGLIKRSLGNPYLLFCLPFPLTDFSHPGLRSPKAVIKVALQAHAIFQIGSRPFHPFTQHGHANSRLCHLRLHSPEFLVQGPQQFLFLLQLSIPFLLLSSLSLDFQLALRKSVSLIVRGVRQFFLLTTQPPQEYV